MKDFDAGRTAKRATEEERTFKIGGETFVALRSVHPSVLSAYDKINKDTGITETLEIVDEVILQMIEDREGAHGNYLKVRANKDDPITVEDLLELVKWLLEAQTDRPTGPPSASASGPTSTEASSTAVSSSPDTPKESTV